MPSTDSPRRIRLQHLQSAKERGEKLTMLTAYDSAIAPILEAGGVDIILIGDSIGNVSLGFDSTLPVSMDDIERATAAVARSTKRVFIVADLPFGSFEADRGKAFAASVALLKAGAHAVKIEGGTHRAELVSFLSANGVPVMGHLGYTPQSINALSGPRLQGRGDSAGIMQADALALEAAGAFAVVLEMVPSKLAQQITKSVNIPTIGIGAGPHCDGQVLVWADMAGLTEWTPRFARRFAELGSELKAATDAYVTATKLGKFPGIENFHQE